MQAIKKKKKYYTNIFVFFNILDNKIFLTSCIVYIVYIVLQDMNGGVHIVIP